MSVRLVSSLSPIQAKNARKALNDPENFTFIVMDGDPRTMQEANRRINRFLGNRKRTVRTWALEDDVDRCTFLTITFDKAGYTPTQFWEFATERMLDTAFSISDFTNKRFFVVPTMNRDGRAITLCGVLGEWLGAADHVGG